MCTKYINPKGTIFIKCDKEKNQAYVLVMNRTEYYERQMNFCPNCGQSLGNDYELRI